MDIIIRQENENDYSAVYDLNAIAFGQNTESELVESLRKSKAFIPELSIVATLDSRIVGHILLTRIIIRDDTGKAHTSLALAPMAVHPALQRQGIGGQLIRYSLEKAKDLGYRSVIVLGHEHYYPKFGFKPAITWDIFAPFEVPSNVFMGLELVANGLKNVKGTVRYPKEFDDV
jgi:putative acetyltransferase